VVRKLRLLLMAAVLAALCDGCAPAHPEIAAPAPAPAQARADVPSQYVGSLVLNQTGAQFYRYSASATTEGGYCYERQPGESVTTWKNGVLDLWSSGKYDAAKRIGACAEVSTTRVWKTGVFETRIYNPGNSKGFQDWPAWWFSSYPEAWPTGGEIDVMEAMEGHEASSYHQGAVSGAYCSLTNATFYPRPDCATRLKPNFTIQPGWHTWDLVWGPTFAKIYIDGRYYGQFSGSYFRPGTMKMIFDITNSPLGDPSGGTSANLLVQYVRVWNFK
jgi:hypothetical protein